MGDIKDNISYLSTIKKEKKRQTIIGLKKLHS